MIRIGIDARFWNETGVGRYTRNLIEQLQQLDKRNEYLLFARSKDYKQIKLQLSNVNFQIKIADIHWHSFEEQIKFPKILRKENLDLMHFPYFSIPILYSKPFIITIHDLILHHFATGEATTKSQLTYKTKLLAYKFIIQTAAQKSQKIITVSKTNKQEIIDHLHVPAEKVSVIYEGVDKKIIAKPETHDTKLQLEDKNYFLHVGNLYPHKNTGVLLQAFQKLKDKKEFQAKLYIVGKKDYFYQKFNQKVKDMKLEDKIILFGELTDKELANLYQHALAMISPSLMEGFDLPTVEAMANECLVLASDIPVHREICKDAAIYFQSNNCDDLMIKLQDIAAAPKNENKKKLELGLAIAKQFSWEKMAKQTIEIYESCLNLRQSQ